VVSEKKRFEVETKLPRNDHWKVLYKFYVFYADRKSKKAATAGHRLTLDPKGAVAAILNFIPEQKT
jgi:transposase